MKRIFHITTLEHAAAGRLIVKRWATRARVLLVLAALSGPSVAAGLDPLRQWPQWRGPLATGEAPYGDPPVRWSERQNIRWKISIPGRGLSTPIIWGDRLFITSAVPFGEALSPPGREPRGAHNNVAPARRLDFVVLAIDRRSGEILWKKSVRRARPHAGTHETGSWASSSAVTDGKYLFAFFGSSGLYCLDFDGNLIWDLDLGEMQIFHGHGEGSSPVLYRDTLVVNWDHQGESFVLALDKFTGRQLWKAARDEITSWSTPIIVPHQGKPQVIVSATGRVRAYDLVNGRLIWEAGGLSRNVVASPVAADGMVYAAGSYDWQAMLAIDLALAEGDITGGPAVVWSRSRDTPYVPSPLLFGDLLWFLRHNQALLTGVDARTGRSVFGPRRLPDLYNVFASPVGAADRVYVTSREGVTVVLRSGGEFELLASNQLDDSFSASPAVVGGELYLRGTLFLYCIAEK